MQLNFVISWLLLLPASLIFITNLPWGSRKKVPLFAQAALNGSHSCFYSTDDLISTPCGYPGNLERVFFFSTNTALLCINTWKVPEAVVPRRNQWAVMPWNVNIFPGQAVGFDLWVPQSVDGVAELKNLQSMWSNTLAVEGDCAATEMELCMLLGGGLENNA